MKLKAINEPFIGVSGTSLCGYITTTKRELTRVFGEWTLLFEDETDTIVATIYDWKNYDHRLGDDEVYEWHIGGHRQTAVNAVYEAFASRGGKTTKEVSNA
jgi:hypothetical protein